MIRRNVGGRDRVARLALGTILVPAGVILATSQQSPWDGGLMVAGGLALLISGTFRFCLLYMPFGISTLKRRGTG